MSGALYRRLLELLPQSPLLVGTVVAVNADGTSTVALPDGGTLVVRGTSVAVDEDAFVRDGVIEGAAPVLPTFTIEI